MILRNCKILNGEDLILVDIKIKGKHIERVEYGIENIDNDEEIDVKRNFVNMGFIDLHTHLREPGYTNKETVKSCTRAAAAGGYTLICAMPNTLPIIDNIYTIREFYNIVEKDAIVDVKTFSAITKNFSDELVDYEELKNYVCGFSNDGVGVQSAKVMYEAMQNVHSCNSFISAHCEQNSLLYNGYVHQGDVGKETNLQGMLSLSEVVQVTRDILLSEATNCKYHVCHISTKETVRAIKQAKADNINVSCEVTPHHLLLTDYDVTDSNFKMNPPLRSINDKEALIKGIIDGVIDVIATDHAPHTNEEKSLGLDKSSFGIVGLETAFPLIYTNFVENKLISLKRCIELFCYNPSNILGLDYQDIKVGSIANLTIVDLKTKRKIDLNKFYSKGKNTPFDKVECLGFPIMTIVNGEVVYDYDKGYIKGEI